MIINADEASISLIVAIMRLSIEPVIISVSEDARCITFSLSDQFTNRRRKERLFSTAICVS